ncbi:MAG: TonB-dependent receptor [Pseudomonadota bacterium]|nr:TonB-dependent receptor [Pseudomonadota bacterium]
MTSLVRSGALAAWVFLCLPNARAHSSPNEQSDPLSGIVVTATRNPQPAGQALEPLVLIDRAALEESLALDVGDVLRFHADLDIGRSGGPGQPLSLFIHGANSAQSIIMIDGVRINAGTIGGAPLQNLAPELFERIEIVKGPRSAIYGTDAIGGVVNLTTRSGGPSGADAMLGYGRYGTGEFAVDGNYTQGDTSVRTALAGQRSSGFAPILGDTLDSGYKNLSGTAAASTRIAGVDLGAFYWRSTGTTDYANGNYNSDSTAFASFTPLSEHFSNSALAAHASGDLTDIWHAHLTLSRIVDDLRQEQIDIFNSPPAGDFDYTSRDTVDLQNDVKIAGAQVDQLVTFGTILTKERTNSVSFGTPYSIETRTQTYYLQDQLEAGPHRLLLAAGYYRHPAFGAHETWNAEYGYAVTADTLLTASAGTAFRAPSATDRFGYGGTPNLKPESSRNFEVGVKSRLGEHQQVTFAAFQDTIDDLIMFVSDPSNHPYFGENKNVARARIRGLEAGWELHEDSWSVRAEGSLQDPRDLSAAASGTELLRRTKHSVTLSGSRRIGRGEIGVDLLQSGARQDLGIVSNKSVSDGGYVLAALYGKLSLTPAWSVTARLDNALDRRYELANGYNTAGRAASLAARYSFR